MNKRQRKKTAKRRAENEARLQEKLQELAKAFVNAERSLLDALIKGVENDELMCRIYDHYFATYQNEAPVDRETFEKARSNLMQTHKNLVQREENHLIESYQERLKIIASTSYMGSKEKGQG